MIAKKYKKYIIGAMIIICLVLIIGAIYFIYEENTWNEEFVTISSGLGHREGMLEEQPATNKLYESQVYNSSVETKNHIYYLTEVTLSEYYNKIYRYNKQTKETELVYATNPGSSSTIRRFTTNGSKLILAFYDCSISVVDIATQVESKIDIPEFKDFAVVGQEIIYNLADGTVWRQNIRTGKSVCIEKVCTDCFVADDEYIYYKDTGSRAGFVSQYSLFEDCVIETDSFLFNGFFIDNGTIVYE